MLTRYWNFGKEICIEVWEIMFFVLPCGMNWQTPLNPINTMFSKFTNICPEWCMVCGHLGKGNACNVPKNILGGPICAQYDPRWSMAASEPVLAWNRKHLLMNLENSGLGFKEVCDFIFNDDLRSRCLQKLRTHILSDSSLLDSKFDFTQDTKLRFSCFQGLDEMSSTYFWPL